MVQSVYKNAFAHFDVASFNPLNAELNPICHLLALLGAHHIFHVSGLRVNFTVFGNKIAICEKENEVCTNKLMDCISLLRKSLCLQ